MASRKEYAMDFMLNARLNGGFSSTFSRAQQEFARLGKDIQSVNRLQSDISSYQKQQTAVENTAAKLQNLQQQHDILQKEIGETTGSTASLEREKLKLEQRIANTSAALETQKQKLEATGSRLKDAGVDTGNLAQKEAELAEKVKQLSAEQEKAADSAQTFGSTAADAFEAASSALVSAGIAAGLKEIADAYMECINIAGDFEAGMSNVKALSGATAAEMDQLSGKAKQLGADTKFSAQESAEAMGYMAMAGWDAAQMLAGMDGVMSLAAASGEDLAMVSDIVTDSMTAFSMTAADTARYADVLAATATKSNTSVAYMGETFKYAAPVAGALRYSIEDVSVAIGLMANASIKGSIAGTSLRNVFDGLLKGATLTADAFGEYEFSAVKADGTMRSFSETIDDLRYYFDQMTEAEKVANAETIAGMQGYSGLLAILNATNEDYAALTNSINNCTGAAQRMAAVKMDNLNGSLELMNGSWEALKTTIGEQLIPEMRDLYSIGDEVFGSIDDFIQKHPAVVKGITTTVGAIGTMAVGITGVAAAIKVATAASALLTATIPGVNVIMGVTAAVAGVAGIITTLSAANNEAVPSVRELTEAASEMEGAMEEAASVFDETVSSTMAAANVADTYIAKLEEMESAGVDTEEEARQYQNTLALLLQVMPSLSDSISQTTDEYGRVTYALDTSTTALRLNTEAWRQNALQQAYQTQLTAIYKDYSDVLLEAEKNSIGLTRAQTDLTTAEQKMAEVVAKMSTIEETGIFDDEYYELQDTFKALSKEIAIAEESIENYEEAIGDGADAAAAAESEISLVTEAINNLTGATEENVGVSEDAAQQYAEIAGAVESVMARVKDLSAAYEDVYNAAYDSISGQYELWDEAATVVAIGADDINSALESQTNYWQNYNENLQTLAGRSREIEGLSDVIATFADGSAESVNAIAGMAAASDEDLAIMVKNWKALQEEQSLAAGSIADIELKFTEAMDRLQTELAADIEAMNLGDEAKESGMETIQGYIDGASDMLPLVEEAYGRLAAAAQSALSPSGGSASFAVPAYASGTRSAAPGLELVGEEVPELVYFGGGEQVLPAMETAALRREVIVAQASSIASGATGSSPPVEVHFHIEGNADAGTVDQLRELGSEIVETVLQTIEDREEDRARRAYR